MRLSIGVRWALRYAIALSITLTLFAGVVYVAVSRRINREAHLVTEIHASELVESLRTQSEEHSREEVLAWITERVERTVRESPPDLALGIQYIDERGEPIATAGSLRDERLAVPGDLLRGERDSALRAVNLGGEHAHIVSVTRAPGGFVQVAIDTRTLRGERGLRARGAPAAAAASRSCSLAGSGGCSRAAAWRRSSASTRPRGASRGRISTSRSRPAARATSSTSSRRR